MEHSVLSKVGNSKIVYVTHFILEQPLRAVQFPQVSRGDLSGDVKE